MPSSAAGGDVNSMLRRTGHFLKITGSKGNREPQALQDRTKRHLKNVIGQEMPEMHRKTGS
jgi:hypothetical protein